MTFDNFLARAMAIINAISQAFLIRINSFSNPNTETLHRLPANILTVQKQISLVLISSLLLTGLTTLKPANAQRRQLQRVAPAPQNQQLNQLLRQGQKEGTQQAEALLRELKKSSS